MRLGPNSEEDGVAGCWGFGRKCKKLPTNASVCNRFLFRKVHTLRDPNPGPRLLLVIVFLGGSCHVAQGREWRIPRIWLALTREAIATWTHGPIGIEFVGQVFDLPS